MKTGAIKTVAVLVLLGTLALSAVVVPDHLASHVFNKHCTICQLIQHLPLLEPEVVADIVQLFQHKEFLFISDDAAHKDSKAIRNFSSRAPPLS